MATAYVGLANTFHDSAIAIVNESGDVVFAEATERYLQNKRAINVRPDLFLRTGELLKEYCAAGDEIVPAFSWSAEQPKRIDQKIAQLETAVNQARSLYGEVPEFIKRNTDLAAFSLHSQSSVLFRTGLGLEYEIGQIEDFRIRLLPARQFDHHLTHAAAACFSSSFEHAVCAVVDGHGEDSAAECYEYRDGKLTAIASQSSARASLGFFYMDICDLCGFGQMSGEEWKVMGLASYGEFDESIYSLMKKMIRVQDLSFDEPNLLALAQLKFALSKLRRRAGEPTISARNLAYAGQRVFTETLCEFLNNLHKRTGVDNLVLAGGCALNSSTNGRILEQTPFKNLFVFSAPADDGNAIGAALLAHRQDHPDSRKTVEFQSPYLGSRMSEETLQRVRLYGQQAKVSDCDGQAPEQAAELLASGKIVGWIQGRAEFGPRALGNRSILADPRLPSIKDEINSRVKFREEFRPLAPAILDEHGDEYFLDYRASPYMERTLKFRPEVMSRVPGVVHRDGTGRLQTVKASWNPLFHRLIKRFHELTQVPLVLNTSFNVMGKPIAHSVEDVLAVFYTSGLDAVFIDDVLLEK